MNRKYCERWLKSCLKKKVSITATTIIMFLMTGLVVNTPIFASVLIGNTDGAPITPNGSVVSSWGITIGGGITNAGSHSVHVGDASLEEGERNVIIGTHATAGVNGGSRQFIRQSVAIGGGASANEGARAFGDQSIAIGANTIAEGNSSIAIGNDDVDRTNTITTKYTNLKGEETTGTIGDAYNALTGKSLMDGGQYRDTKSKEAAVAIGVKALAGNISLALGTASSADVVNGVAIGTGATVTRDNAIAIGGGATTEKEGTKEVDVTVNGIHYTWKGGENTIAGDVVSFGKEGYERQLKHVAAGKVSKDSTDAINGSQLHGVLEHITSEPVYFYAADNSSLDKITGTTAEAKNADALAKKIVARSMSNHRLNILGGATGDLSDNNIGVNYENDSTLRVKLAKELKDLKSTEFKNDTGDVATITGNGLTITPNGNAVSNKNVSVTKDGLNNGGNVIADVGGNLAGAKTGTTAPTTNATVPNNVDSIKNNAATVGDVLNAGWNLQNNGEAKDFVKPYDTVNFVDGSGTTAVVDTAADRSTSKIKYNVNLGNGLEKDDANNKITVKADEKSLTVGADGVKAKTDNKTITTGDNGLKVVTGRIESANSGTMQVKEGDTGKIATVDSVVNAVNNAAFTLKASSTTGGTRNTNSTVEANGEAIKAGKTIEMIAGKNLDVKHDENGKITFATVENPSFSTVQVGGDQGPKFSKTSDGNIKVSGPNGADLVKITNVKDGDVNENSKDAINGSQFHKLANNIIKLAGKNGSDAATETDAQTLNQQNGIKFTVKSSDGKLLDVTAGGDTITITPKTGTITVGADGVPTATTTNGKLVTADQLVSALTEMGWKATADKDGTGTVTGTTSELIKAGETVTFKAGDNLKIKQDGKNFIYSLNTALSGLTSAEFKDDNKNKVNITPTGITITKPADTVNNQPEKTVTLNQDGLNNGGNLITNVASNLKTYDSGNKNGLVDLSNTTTTPNSNVATVGDLRNMGWVVSSDKSTEDLGKAYNDKVKNADEVKFVGKGAATVSGKTENGVRTITVGVTVPSVEKGSINTATTGADEGKVVANKGDGDKFTTVDTVVNAINSAAWKATSDVEGTGKTATTGHTQSKEEIKAGDIVTFKAGDNLKIKQFGKEFTYSLNPELTDLSKVEVKDTAGNSVVTTPTGTTITAKDTTDPTKDITTVINAGGTTVTDKDGNTTKVDGNGITITPSGNKDSNKNVSVTKDGINAGEKAITNVASNLTNYDSGNKARLVDLSNTTTTPNSNVATVGDLRNMGWVVSSDKTTGDLGTAYDDKVKNADEVKFVGTGTATVSGKTVDGVRTITVEVNDQVSTNNSVTPVVYTKADGTKVYPIKQADGTTKFFEKPDGTGTEIPKEEVITSVNGPEGTTTPSTLSNVAGNLEGAKTGTQAPTTNATLPNTTDKTGNNYINPNNAATVGDVLNAGWNLQNNGTAKDFVRPYDTVNFVDGLNTKAIVTTDKDGKVSNVQIDVKDLPIAYTNAAGDKVVKAADGKYYKESDLAGKVYDPTTDTFKNADGAATAQPTEVAKDNIKTNLVNPNAAADKTATTDPSTLGNVKSGLDTIKEADNKAAAGLVNLNDKDDAGNYKVSDNNVATVGDLRNMGWVVSSDKTTGNLGTAYNDQVRNANEVKFVGKGTATVSGKTEGNVRTITVEVNDQVSTNNSVTPVVYTKADGTKVYPIKQADGTTKFFEKPDGTGTEIPKEEVITSVNGPEGTTTPSTLSNVAGNLEGAKTGTQAPTTNATLPNTTDKTGNNYINPNNAATVGDVLNAGWNLQNNGTAKDFVRPYDTVNFVDGLNTKAIVTTDKDGKVSNVQIDVKDLPIAYTNAAGDKVVKAADGKYYKESDLAGKVYDPTTDTFKNADGAATAQPTEVAKDNIKTNLVNPNAAADKTATTDPSTLGNVKSGLDTIKEADNKAAAGLVNLNDKDDAGNYKVSDNNVATVGDLRNMGWVVSASDNGYTNTVKNANKVDFKGGNGIEVTGKTTADGTREITVAIKEGAVTNNVKVTKEDGTVIEAIRDKDGKLYQKDNNGKADKTKPVVLTAKDKVENNGSGFVTGNNVATAIQDSGWNLGKAKDVNKAFETEAKVHDKVNPNDDVNFVDGDNTTVSMVNVNAENTDGTSKTITYIKTDIKRDINIDSITIGRKNPEKSVTLTDKGLNNGGNNITNVAGNLDGAKTGTTAPTTNHAGVDTTTPTAANYVNPHNAATVGDVLNAGWNLKNNGTAKDFVKPYDTVNFVDGINTKVTVTTDPDGTKSDVRVDVVGLPIAFADKNGNRLVQGKDPVGNPVYYRMLSDGTVDKTLIIPASDVTVTNVNPVDSKINTVGTKGGAVISGIANGAKTYDAPTDKDGKDLKLGNDGKWYPADSVLINNKYYPAGSVVSKNGNVYPAGTTLDKDGNPTTSGTTPVTEVKSVVKPKNPGKAGLINFGHSNSDTTNAATVGDLQNMGWVVSTSDTGYNDQVRNANVVDFKEGEGIKISGETLENGVRQIKVGIDKNVVATKQELAQVERLSSAGIAGVAAMANIPQINEAASNRYNIAVGVGYHKGEKALAVGISGVSDGGRVVYKASAALDSQKQTTVGLGVGYQFGKRDIEPNELDRFRAQLDLVNTQKSSLAQRLKEETHKVVELNNKVEELEKQNKMLNEKMDLILKKLGGK